MPVADIDEAVTLIESDVRAALRKAARNVRAAAEAQLRKPLDVELQDGQHIEIVEPPVRRAAAYVPGGQGAVPIDRGDVRGHGARRRGGRVRRLRAARARAAGRTR